MKVLVLASLAESLANFRGKLLLALTQSGAEVHAAAPALSADATASAAMARIGVRCHDIPLARTGLNPWRDGATVLALYRRLRQVRPTHFLAYTIKPVIYGIVAAWLAGVPQRTALITGLGYAFNAEARGLRGLLQRLLRLMYRFALARATRVIFQNPDDRALFIQLDLVAPEKTVVVNGSGIPLEDFPQQPLPPQGPCHFLLIARLLGDKGIHEYIAAARLVKQRHPDRAVFHLVGWIDSNPAAIKQSDLDSWIAEGLIQFHGKLSNVRPPLTACHVYVLPSYREGTPRTVLEAMATGRAVITTNAPGCRETVTDGDNGYLVPVADADALAAAMLRFLDQPALIAAMGQRGRDIAADKYDVHKVNAHMLHHMGVTR
ncbi:glycosyltransferase [Duganella sp. FT50W]|uniref:Glycosyltransferase n=1 Tax=Duganella lactea TaxID=2692173 RepID=A0A6L8ML61_9BURK|nr:glycosyltransferase family 4 protein [Duganella lactea]MYM82951.1 glycosyltransferase [Duganella lactea]